MPGRGARRSRARRGAVGAVGRRGRLLPRAPGAGAAGAGRPAPRRGRGAAHPALRRHARRGDARRRPGRHPPRRGLPVGAVAAGPARRGGRAGRGPHDPPRRRLRQPGARRVPAGVDRGRRPPHLRQPPLGGCSRARSPRRRGGDRRTAWTAPASPRGRLDRAARGRAPGMGSGPPCSRWGGSSHARGVARCSAPSPGRASGSASAPCWRSPAGRPSSTTPTTGRRGSDDAQRLGLRVHRGRRPPRRRRRRRARPDPRRRHAGALPRGRPAGLPLRARGLRPGGAGGPGGRAAGRGERPARAARVPRRRPRLPDGARRRRRRAGRRAGGGGPRR